jgi:cell filamentation protein
VTGAAPYLHPGTAVLRNKLGIKNAADLGVAERQLVARQAMFETPSGQFDLAHLHAIHAHLFQHIYEWAGELRTVEIAKGGNHFIAAKLIERGMGDVHRRLHAASFLHGLSRTAFAAEAGKIIGDVNYVHPFREGNGRTQMYYLEQLARQARHPLDLGRFDPTGWIEVSRAAHDGDCKPMGDQIAQCIITKPRRR